MRRRTVWDATPRSVRWQLHLLLVLPGTGCALFDKPFVGTTTCLDCPLPGTTAAPTTTDTGATDTGATDTGATDTGATDTGATDTGADTGYTFTGTVSARGGRPIGLGALPKPTSRHGR